MPNATPAHRGRVDNSTYFVSRVPLVLHDKMRVWVVVLDVLSCLESLGNVLPAFAAQYPSLIRAKAVEGKPDDYVPSVLTLLFRLEIRNAKVLLRRPKVVNKGCIQ